MKIILEDITLEVFERASSDQGGRRFWNSIVFPFGCMIVVEVQGVAECH